ncbi:MAG: hypothetical protein KBC83_04745 [Candidatus Moranbacteria bacterium]|nr:hypothetical protein [Candidatus Moranbacteria bacterium]MBP9801938.1 hypothetical protein [Candidatus Moranbacteria bacterium]
MKRILRIKINGIAFINLSYLPNNKSYILTIPKMSPPDGSFLENHLSFHTANNRITHKITNAGDAETKFDSFKNDAENKGYRVTDKDIDLLGGMILDESKLNNSLVHWSYFSYNFLHDDYLQKTTGKTKTKDNEFIKGVINLKTSIDLPAIYVAFYISKNLSVNPEWLVHEVARMPIHKKFFITDEQDGHIYTFSILVKLAEKYMVKR